MAAAAAPPPPRPRGPPPPRAAAEPPPAAPRGPKVLGVGSAGVDYLAQVAAFPAPDAKLRTERLEAQGGGNAGNALVAAARLGAAPALVSKIGGDALGDGILAEFAAEGVAADWVLRAHGAPSPFTYIIVDRAGGTRTCIHTAGEPLRPGELSDLDIAAAVAGAAAVYFDGRLADAALPLAEAAAAAGVPVLVEAERLRPGLDALLALADFVVTSAHFPAAATGEPALGDALLALAARFPRARWVATTLGARGAALLERGGAPAAEPAAAEEVLARLFAEAEAAAAASAAFGGRGAGGVEVGMPGVAADAAPRLLRPSGGALGGAAAAAVAAAAAAAAEANADAGAGARYAPPAAASDASSSAASVVGRLTVTTAARLPHGAVVDTTGAGDAFIGAMLTSIAAGHTDPAAALRLGAVVAAAKCTALGARPGLPRRADLAPELFL
jgi:sugar/nucleoside kinase (ribokinase family)